MSQRRARSGGPAPVPADGRRAGLLRSLATLLDSGIDPRRAFAILARDAPPDRRKTLRRVGGNAGPAPVTALERAGLLTAAERPRIEAMQATGRLERGLALLAEDLEARAAILSRIRARLVLPAVIWLAALFIPPIPGLFTGELSALGYAAAVGQPLVVTILAVWLAWRNWHTVLRWIENRRLENGRPPGLARRRQLLQELGRNLEAGLDAGRALVTLGEHHRGEWGRRLAAAGRAAGDGRPVVACLHEQGLLADATDQASLEAGEASGRLAEAMLHRAGILDEQQRLRGEILAEWIPRAIYLLVVFWVAYGLIAAGPPVPSV